ncbi:MAG: IS4 family transposase [Planctomycetota bacterium]|nr:IS4 family transposase [Planctomycetota bacterium]MDA1211865.1 IS4 family transposase [Planctomycetota bacterium]
MLQENADWIAEQFQACRLGDVRRTNRLLKVAGHMLESPEQSLPQQNAAWSDVKAAYRLFAAKGVSFAEVASPHWELTRQTAPGRYLLISDTTDDDQGTHKATQGLSQLGNGQGRGLQLHSCLMVESDTGIVRGTAGALVHYRPIVSKRETRTQRLKRIRESELWGRLVDAVGSPPEGAQWIHVFDRGGDNFEAFCHLKLSRCDWVVRAAKLNRNVIDSSGNKVFLKEALEAATVLGHYELALRSRPGQRARRAQLEVASLAVQFPRPHIKSAYVKQCGITSIEMNVVIVREIDAPKGVKPICWVLLTNLPVETFEEAWQVIEDYERRWLIEEYHKVLKSGCNMEGHALRTTQRLEPLLALTSVIGVRLLQLKTIARTEPETKAKHRIPFDWLQVLKALKPRIDLASLTVYQFFRELAKLGGFLARKHDGEPGWQTIWRGHQKIHAVLFGMELERKRNKNCG